MTLNFMTFIYATSFFICGVMLSLMVSGIIAVVIISGIKIWNRKFFIAFFTVLTLLVISYFVDLVTSLYSTAVIAGRISTFFEFFLFRLLC